MFVIERAALQDVVVRPTGVFTKFATTGRYGGSAFAVLNGPRSGVIDGASSRQS